MTLVRNDRKRHEVEESGVIGGGNDRKARKARSRSDCSSDDTWQE
jgi:hypothetical protein